MDIAFRRTSRLPLVRVAAVRLTEIVRRWWRWRVERWELLAMNERELRDIGLTRTDARQLADKPFRPW